MNRKVENIAGINKHTLKLRGAGLCWSEWESDCRSVWSSGGVVRRQGRGSCRFGGSGDEQSSTVPNPKGEMKAVTTRSGLAYEGPSIPTESPLEKVDEQNTEEILDKEHSNSLGSTAQVQSLVVPISIPEPDVLSNQKKPTIPYPSSRSKSTYNLREVLLENWSCFNRCIWRGNYPQDFLNDDSIPTGIENSVYDPEGDILFLKKLLNEDSFQLPPMDHKLVEESKEKSFVEEPPKLELKELPSHLKYAFLEDFNKLPVIIVKNLKVDEREALINVLKSHKRAIAWKISDIKGIDPRFYTHKILMEDDYKPAVQSQRRVNHKIHEVIKKEVIKLLDAGMIYPISDIPWVSPIYYVPKKIGMIVVANDNNELIPTRLVTGWRVCIEYRKLNDDTRKYHFPLPFMDQMLESDHGTHFCNDQFTRVMIKYEVTHRLATAYHPQTCGKVKVNGHRMKHYFSGDIPSNVAPDLHTFPNDN
nr:reverse transcriptase domain-containing protein [Tanacetum cinerariifolium]